MFKGFIMGKNKICNHLTEDILKEILYCNLPFNRIVIYKFYNSFRLDRLLVSSSSSTLNYSSERDEQKGPT